MHRVPRCEFNPGYCAITGRSEDPEGFIDTGNNIPVMDPRIFVSVSGAHRLAQEIGYEPLQAQINAREQIANQAEQIKALRARVADQEAQIKTLKDAISLKTDPEPPVAALAA